MTKKHSAADVALDRLLDPWQVSLVLVDLSENRLVPYASLPAGSEYVCVSHVWGENIKRFPDVTAIEGITWKIPLQQPDRAQTILNTIRNLTPHRYIWMDILCMNQDQAGSVSAQIEYMGMYYGKAARSIQIVADVSLAQSLLEMLGKFKQSELAAKLIPTASTIESKDLDEEKRTGLLKAIHSSGLADVLSLLGSNVYFKRVWTLQEAVLPAAGLFLFNTCAIDADLVYDVAALAHVCTVGVKLDQYKQVVGGGEMTSAEYLAMKDNLLMLRMFSRLRNQKVDGNVNLTFADVCHLIKGRDCTKMQDKIYGILGMVPGFQGMTADYGLDLKELSRLAYVHLASHGDTSFLFSTVPFNRYSWIPSETHAPAFASKEEIQSFIDGCSSKTVENTLILTGSTSSAAIVGHFVAKGMQEEYTNEVQTVLRKAANVCSTCLALRIRRDIPDKIHDFTDDCPNKDKFDSALSDAWARIRHRHSDTICITTLLCTESGEFVWGEIYSGSMHESTKKSNYSGFVLLGPLISQKPSVSVVLEKFVDDKGVDQFSRVGFAYCGCSGPVKTFELKA
ncbi:hypothetical protein HK098_003686 [Nowakowskiella sp. JEL0407]|nr:hypothetical protein HK098_003686 [Nowakowskiella sp. JEL0407]